jgi:hypothetical protein
MKNKREKKETRKAKKEEEEHLPILLETWSGWSSTAS